MNKLTRHLGPATRSAVIFHGRPHHVNVFGHRAAFRCIHSGSGKDTAGTPSGDEPMSSNLRGESDGFDGESKGNEALFSWLGETEDGPGEERLSESKPENSGEIMDKELSIALRKVEQSMGGKNKPLEKRATKMVFRKVNAVLELEKGRGPPIRKIEGVRVRKAVYEVAEKLITEKPDDTFRIPNPNPSPRESAMFRHNTKKFSTPPREILERSCTLEYEFPERVVRQFQTQRLPSC